MTGPFNSSPLRSGHFSSWEARHDVNNLDHYQTKVKKSEPTPPPSSSNIGTRKRKASADSSTHRAKKKAKKSSNDDIAPKSSTTSRSTTIDTNMDLVLQLTPRKSTPVKPKATISDDLPNALGLVPKTGGTASAAAGAVTPKTPEIFRTPSKPPGSSGKKTRIKAVQRNLLDEDGFTSPLKIPSYSPPKNVQVEFKWRSIAEK